MTNLPIHVIDDGEMNPLNTNVVLARIKDGLNKLRQLDDEYEQTSGHLYVPDHECQPFDTTAQLAYDLRYALQQHEDDQELLQHFWFNPCYLLTKFVNDYVQYGVRGVWSNQDDAYMYIDPDVRQLVFTTPVLALHVTTSGNVYFGDKPFTSIRDFGYEHFTGGLIPILRLIRQVMTFVAVPHPTLMLQSIGGE